MKIADAAAEFQRGYFSTHQRSSKTRKSYAVDLLQMEQHFGPKKSLESVSPTALEEWIMRMRDKQLKTTTIRRKVAVVRLFFNYWVRRGTLDASPFWKVRLDLKCERQLPRNLSPRDMKRLIEHVWAEARQVIGPFVSNLSDVQFRQLRDLAVVEILFATGMRVSELVNLSLDDWQEDESCFVVTGKGSVQRLAFLPDERSVHAVRLYISARKHRPGDSAFLLVSASGRHFKTQGVARVLRRFARDATISHRVTPHMIRHTVATLLLRYGADIRIVQEVLGHASISTTQRYVHVSKEHLRTILKERHPSHHLSIDTRPYQGSFAFMESAGKRS